MRSAGIQFNFEVWGWRCVRSQPPATVRNCPQLSAMRTTVQCRFVCCKCGPSWHFDVCDKVVKVHLCDRLANVAVGLMALVLPENGFESLWIIALAVKNSLANACERQAAYCLTDVISKGDTSMCMTYAVCQYVCLMKWGHVEHQERLQAGRGRGMMARRETRQQQKAFGWIILFLSPR